MLAPAEGAMERRYALRARGVDLALIASRASEVLGAKPEEVWAEREVSEDCRGKRVPPAGKLKT